MTATHPAARVIAGPAKIGNIFGFYGRMVPAGRYAVVTDGEYSDGGWGPIATLPTLYASEAEAKAALAAMP